MTPFLAYMPWRDAIAGVLDQRRYSFEWLDGEVMAGKVLVWTAPDAIILAEIRTYPTGAKDVHGLVAAGNLATIVNELIPKAEHYGRTQGCVGAVIEGNPAWQRMLKSSGYGAYQLTLRKDL